VFSLEAKKSLISRSEPVSRAVPECATSSSGRGKYEIRKARKDGNEMPASVFERGGKKGGKQDFCLEDLSGGVRGASAK